MIEAARQLAEAEFAPQVQASRYAALFEELVAEGRPASVGDDAADPLSDDADVQLGLTDIVTAVFG